MNPHAFESAKADLQWLRGEDGVVSEAKAIERLANVLRPILSTEGYEISIYSDGRDPGFDLLAMPKMKPASPKIGVDYKHHTLGHPVGAAAVRHLIGAASTLPFERALLISRFGFTADALKLAHEFTPVTVQLFDLNGLAAWIDRLEKGPLPNADRVIFLIKSVSDEFAKLVAANPNILDHLEWRDLERMMERVMEGIGFSVTLTPPSKDGGKDLILTCMVENKRESYIIELKHWRAGKKVGRQAVSDFLQVIVSESRTGGLFLSTSGYTVDPFEGITEINRHRLGNRAKIVLLTQTYVKASSGLWSPPTDLLEVLFESTIDKVDTAE